MKNTSKSAVITGYMSPLFNSIVRSNKQTHEAFGLYFCNAILSLIRDGYTVILFHRWGCFEYYYALGMEYVKREYGSKASIMMCKRDNFNESELLDSVQAVIYFNGKMDSVSKSLLDSAKIKGMKIIPFD